MRSTSQLHVWNKRAVRWRPNRWRAGKWMRGLDLNQLAPVAKATTCISSTPMAIRTSDIAFFYLSGYCLDRQTAPEDIANFIFLFDARTMIEFENNRVLLTTIHAWIFQKVCQNELLGRGLRLFLSQDSPGYVYAFVGLIVSLCRFRLIFLTCVRHSHHLMSLTSYRAALPRKFWAIKNPTQWPGFVLSFFNTQEGQDSD
ncbi:hypothetical protein NTD84_03210 [Pseudomonas sp. 14P_8.1_Bac3]|uniref:hypothetical protein n=1 Tax=Pseudomonas sp. 14P_8.1_Bac3 TaxID=2971621 RepID=UPI0021C7F541|nr:hypothetical protein [Pseudomonas sp. 14P_8.1_Bac3]MCU1758729.1 hypothetical protein [Pseudomonas sp. 14P_8.1_Bac3]